MGKITIDLSSLFTGKGPEANDLYGATQGEDGLWRDASGKVIDNGGKPIISDMVSKATPMQQPTYWQRVVNPQMSKYADVQNSNAALIKPMAQIQADADANAANNVFNKYVYSQDPSRFGNVTEGQANSLRLYPQSLVNQNRFDVAKANTGSLEITGDLGGQTDIAKAQQSLEDAKASLNRNSVVNAAQDQEAVNRLSTALKVEPLVIQHTVNQLRTEIGQDPTEAQIIDAVNKTKLATANQAVTDIPINTGTQLLTDIGNNASAGHVYFPNRDTSIDNLVTPLGVIPQPSKMDTLMNSVSGGSKSPTLPNGQPLPMKATAPTLGTAYQNQSQAALVPPAVVMDSDRLPAPARQIQSPMVQVPSTLGSSVFGNANNPVADTINAIRPIVKYILVDTSGQPKDYSSNYQPYRY